MNWKLINTAPKDGTLILTIDIKLPNSYSVRKWEVDDYGDGQWQPRIRGVFPTHWICLPKYPMTIKEIAQDNKESLKSVEGVERIGLLLNIAYENNLNDKDTNELIDAFAELGVKISFGTGC